jgi:hypothetical protein
VLFGDADGKKSGGPSRLNLVSSMPTKVESTPTGSRPERKLGPDGQALWDKIRGPYEITRKADLETLRLVCEARDKLCAIEQQIKRDGLMVMGRNGIREHPLLRAEAQLRGYISRYLQRLIDPSEPRCGPGRPGGGGIGITWRQLEQREEEEFGLDEDDTDDEDESERGDDSRPEE